MININFTVSTDIARNFVAYNETLEEFAKVIKSDINYSPFIFANNHRNEANSLLEYCNSLVFDFDDNIDLIDAINTFKIYTNIIATTRSHQKEKNGVTRDRFRVVLPLAKTLSTTKDNFKKTMSLLIYRYGADNACKDIARFFYGYEGSEVIVNNGKFLFDYDVAEKQALLWYKIKELQSKPIQVIKPQIQYSNNMTKLEWLTSILFTPKFLEYIKFENFCQGGRNQYLYSKARHLMEEGLDNETVKECILWLNASGDGIEQQEIERTIFKSLRL